MFYVFTSERDDGYDMAGPFDRRIQALQYAWASPAPWLYVLESECMTHDDIWALGEVIWERKPA